MSKIILAYALTCWLEARSEGYMGIHYVSDVIYNRAAGDPGKVMAVISASNQFACWNNRDISTADIPPQANDHERDLWRYCVELATTMTQRRYSALIHADCYWRVGIEKKAWMYETEHVIEYKNHWFAKRR
jgi:spore germination cell wall hydrolase CwlJ-like protein